MNNSLERLQRIDPLCEEFEDELLAGVAPHYDHYLNQVGAEDRPVLFRHLVHLHWDYANRSGRTFDSSQLRAEHPQFSQIIDEAIAGNQPTGANSTLNEYHGKTYDPPRLLGKYTLLQELGRGGMGVVWKAQQHGLDRFVAIKTIKSAGDESERLRERFRAEAIAVSQLNHPGIVPIYEIGENDSQLYFSMAYMPGGALSERIKDRTFASLEAARVLHNLAQAIDHCHQRGIIHRDLKPANILIDTDGTLKISDFGLACQVDRNTELTMTGEVIGTPNYMSPEQVNGSATRLSDIYSLGAILYRLLVGQPPFQAASLQELFELLLYRSPVRPTQIQPGVPRDLETICLKCLEKNPARRYQSAQELVAELDRYLAGKPILARPISRFQHAWRWCQRNPAIAILLSTIMLLLLAGTGISSYFAVLANRRLEDSRQANGQLVVAEQVAQQKSREAEAKTIRANAETERALTILEGVLFEIEPILETRDDLEEPRRRMLKILFDHVQQLENLDGASPRLQVNVGYILTRIANVYSFVGNENGEHGITAADKVFQQAIEIFESLHRKYPTEKQYAGLLGQAYAQHGDHLFHWGEYRQAKTVLEQALPILKKLLDEDPSNLHLLKDLLHTQLDWIGNEMYLGKHLQVKQKLIEFHQQVKDLANRYPSDRGFLFLAMETSERMGDLYLAVTKDFDKVKSSFEDMDHYTAKIIAIAPDPTVHEEDVANMHERWGNLYMKMGDGQNALKRYQLFREALLPMEGRAPNNSAVLLDNAIAWQKIAQACLMIKDDQAALNAWNEALLRERKLMQIDPRNLRQMQFLVRGLEGKLKTLVRLKNQVEAKATYQELIKALHDFDQQQEKPRFQAKISQLQTAWPQFAETVP
ncbi:MAG: serine/threonine-protein kinase [Zavarzinella sp.]